jgi:23S rRNA (adenine2503-C2)-methyltransferase
LTLPEIRFGVRLQKVMTDKTNVCGLSRSGFESLMVELGQKPYRGRQIYKWIYKNRAFDFDHMSDLGKELRAILQDRCYISLPKISAREKAGDGTEKFLFELDDRNVIESVLIPDEESGRTTLCISSQSGCALGCKFCATGYFGFRRDLTVGEIVGQVLVVRELYGDEAFENIVFMGMGEPLLNYDNVMAAIAIMTDSLGLMLGAKRITISTSGVIAGIKKLTASGSKVNLALSLHAASDEKRKKIMPIANRNTLADLMEALRDWAAVRNRRVTFEYILFKGFNDSDDDALALAKLVRGMPCKINLLAYNPVAQAGFIRPSEDDINHFAQILYPRTPAVTVRKSRGKDINAACGQLAGKKGYACVEP